MNDMLLPLAGNSPGYVPAHVPLAANTPDLALVNLTELLQYGLIARRQQIQALQAIVRFDALPHVNSTRPAMAQMFSHILNSILQHQPPGTKLLIYIKCEREVNDIIDLSLADGFQQYEISVFTNIKANENWRQQQQTAIGALKEIAENIKGSFESFSIDKTGCLYKMLLPGKFI